MRKAFIVALGIASLGALANVQPAAAVDCVAQLRACPFKNGNSLEFCQNQYDQCFKPAPKQTTPTPTHVTTRGPGPIKTIQEQKLKRQF